MGIGLFFVCMRWSEGIKGVEVENREYCIEVMRELIRREEIYESEKGDWEKQGVPAPFNKMTILQLSFPSGHASMAFAAARSIDKEFRSESIWIPIAGYAAATAVGIERVANNKHHWYDVVAGAGLGVGAAELTWWLSDKMFGKGSNVAVGSSGNTVDVTYNF